MMGISLSGTDATPNTTLSHFAAMSGIMDTTTGGIMDTTMGGIMDTTMGGIMDTTHDSQTY